MIEAPPVPGRIPRPVEDDKKGPPPPQPPQPDPETNLCDGFTADWMRRQLEIWNPQIFDIMVSHAIWKFFYSPPYDVRFAGDLWPILTIEAVDQLVVKDHVTADVKAELKLCIAGLHP